MNPSLDVDMRDGLRIREGGGCVAVFGLPFFGSGLFLFLVAAGVIPLSNADTMAWYGWPLLALMGVAFTAVGGGLAFGRSWTTIDREQRCVRKQWGLLLPMREDVLPCHLATAVSLGLKPGDSDSVDRYPVGLTLAGGTEVPLVDFTDYGKAREYARAAAEHLGLDIEDGSSDHTVRVSADQVALSFRERWRTQRPRPDPVEAPSTMQSRIHRGGLDTVIALPSPRPGLLEIAGGLLPVVILVFMAPPLAEFFRRTHTPDPVGWFFLGFMTLVLGAMPAVSMINAFRRARRGGVVVTVSRTQGLRVQQRGAWRTRTTAQADAEDVLDVDFSVRETALAATRRATEREVQRLRQTSGQVVGPRMERLMAALGRFVSARGVIVKTRRGIETFGQGLDDSEIRYLADVVRRALVE